MLQFYLVNQYSRRFLSLMLLVVSPVLALEFDLSEYDQEWQDENATVNRAAGKPRVDVVFVDAANQDKVLREANLLLENFDKTLSLKLNASKFKVVQDKIKFLNNELLRLKSRLEIFPREASAKTVGFQYDVKKCFADLLFKKYKAEFKQLVAIDLRSSDEKFIAMVPVFVAGCIAAVVVVYGLIRIPVHLKKKAEQRKKEEEDRRKREEDEIKRQIQLQCIAEKEAKERAVHDQIVEDNKGKIDAAAEKLNQIAGFPFDLDVDLGLALVLLPLLEGKNPKQAKILCGAFCTNGPGCSICLGKWTPVDDVGKMTVCNACSQPTHTACLGCQDQCPLCRGSLYW